MCGRYVSVSTPEQLAEAFEVDRIATPDQGRRFNVAPTLDVYAVIERDDERRLGTMRWGFVPHWSKSLKGRAPINARIETVATNGMFARSFERRRCILPADGFYEWQEREDSTRKQPWYIHDPEDRPLAFAGIWTVWRDPDDPEAEPVFSTAIVTTDAKGEMTRLHDRMPVILPRTLHRDWLTASEDEAPHLLRAIRAMPVPALRAHTVTDRVNNVRNDGPDLVEETPPLAT
jgi:putative SOS response-associated peptidase YedK